MSLSIALNNALSGLNVNQQQLSVLSQNIANANTQGYSKQTARQNALTINGQGNGVALADVIRKVDEYLTSAVQKQNSLVSSTTAVNDYNTRIQLLMGNPGSQNSLDAYINTFFNSIQSLVQTPQNTTLQQSAVNNGFSLATQLSTLSDDLRTLQLQADQDISKALTEVNADLKRVFELNNLITSGISLGRSVADLQDQRDIFINKISANLNISTFTQSNGAVSIITGSGITLLDSTMYQISYNGAASAVTFSDGTALGAITVARVNAAGQIISPPATLATSNTPANVSSVFTSGKIAGLMEIRDKQVPNIVSQLDTMAAGLRDYFNAIHNAGSGYPGAYSMTGTRGVFANQVNQWDGKVRIAVLDSNGQPAPALYADEPNGMKPLLLDLENMNTGSGQGIPSVQGIIDAINGYFGTPQTKLSLGNVNNIQLVSDSQALPGTPPKLNFDFNLNNLSGQDSEFFVTGVTVKNNNNVDITSVTDTIPRVTLAATNTYVTTIDSSIVTVNASGAHGLSEGQWVYLSTPPGGPYNGIPASNLGGYFQITNVTANSFRIDTRTYADAGSGFNVGGQSAQSPYATSVAGEDVRARSGGIISADLTMDTASPYYTVSVSMAVIAEDGTVSRSVVDYRIDNNQSYALNRVYGAQTQVGEGRIVAPSSLNSLMTAKLVDENGVELPKISGQYTSEVPGFLKLSTGNQVYTIAIDSMDSREMGNPTVSPVVPGSDRGFSHYFELNNFFVSNRPTNTGDTTAGSALNMAISQNLRDNPGLLSLGQMIKTPNSPNPELPPNYTYQLNPGDNSVIMKMSALSANTINFKPAGGLGATLNTLSGYTGQIIGAAAANSSLAKANKTNAENLLEGFNENASAISGVNLDVELANTVIYQNAYSASARVITVTQDLFDVLLNSFQ